jgi:ABC-type Fe3+ transport system permease subunit
VIAVLKRTVSVAWSTWESAGVALAVGALIGAERGRSAHRREAGVRSIIGRRIAALLALPAVVVAAGLFLFA